MKTPQYLYGIPMLSHFTKSFVQEFYKLLFLVGNFSADRTDMIVKTTFDLNKNEDDLANLMKMMKKEMMDYRDGQEKSDTEITQAKNKIQGWITCFPDITEDELKEYFRFHLLPKPAIREILGFRTMLLVRAPSDIKKELDRVVIGQEKAKRVMSFAFYLHLIRNGIIKPHIHKLKGTDGSRPDVLPKPNILLIGPTGSGKTLTIKTLCSTFSIPFIKVDCSSLASSGYVGTHLNDHLKQLIKLHGRNKTEKAVIFFDEFDKVSEINIGASGRGSVGGVELQQEFLSFLEDRERIVTRTNNEEGPSHEILNIENLMLIFSGSFHGVEEIIRKRLDANNKEFTKYLKSSEELKEEENILQKIRYTDIMRFGIIPELTGRLGFIAVLDKLTEKEIVQIMKEAAGGIIEQYHNYFMHHFDRLVIREEVYTLMAGEVIRRNIGARAIDGIIIELLQDLLYNAPNTFEEEFIIDKEFFMKRFSWKLE